MWLKKNEAKTKPHNYLLTKVLFAFIPQEIIFNIQQFFIAYN